MISPVLLLFLSFLCHVATAGRTCPKPEELPFATVTPLQMSYDPGEQITYSCKPGYQSRGGMRRFTCPLSGIWPINTLKCIHGYFYSPSECGSVTSSWFYFYSQTLSNQPDRIPGNFMQKLNTKKTIWTYLGFGYFGHRDITFVKTRVCPFAGILPNGVVRYSTFEYPNTISFACNAGFYLNGTKSSQCTEEGRWSPDIPVCAPVHCPPPPTPKFAVLSISKSLATNSSFSGDSALYGNKVVFKCLPHYAMFGNDTVTCTKHGNWTELPECREVKCPFPSRPNNGFVNYPAKEALYYKDKATYGCHEKYVLDGPQEVECSKFGNWSAQPSCKASCTVSVKKATVIFEGERVKIQEKFKNGMLHGQKVSFFCKNKEKKCSYTEDAECIDGTLEIPKCFKEHSSLAFWKTDASDVKPC